jgi:hypothetical protein
MADEKESSFFGDIIGGAKDLIGFGLDVYQDEKQRELAAEQTGVKKALAEAEIERSTLEAQRVIAESEASIFKTATLERIAIILSAAASVISIAFLIFGGDE